VLQQEWLQVGPAAVVPCQIETNGRVTAGSDQRAKT